MTTTSRPDTLSDPHAPSVRKVAGLSGRSVRTKTGLTLVEGPQAVRELVRDAPDTVKDVYVTHAVAGRLGDLMAEVEAACRYVHPVSEKVARVLAPAGQGIVAVARTQSLSVPLADAFAGPAPFVVVMARTQDPGNAGTIIRLADATGASAVVACAGGVDVTSPKVIRASVGSVFHIPLVVGCSLAEVVSHAHLRGVTVLGADGAAQASLPEVVAGGDLDSVAWVLGNEAQGLDRDEVDLLDRTVSIPMWGRAESYNVAAAAAICLFETALARQGKGIGDASGQ